MYTYESTATALRAEQWLQLLCKAAASAKGNIKSTAIEPDAAAAVRTKSAVVKLFGLLADYCLYRLSLFVQRLFNWTTTTTTMIMSRRMRRLQRRQQRRQGEAEHFWGKLAHCAISATVSLNSSSWTDGPMALSWTRASSDYQRTSLPAAGLFSRSVACLPLLLFFIDLPLLCIYARTYI